MELFSIHLSKTDNSYFVFSVNVLSIFYKKINLFTDKMFFYTNCVVRKRFTVRFRVRRTDALWIKKIMSLFVINITSCYIPGKCDLCESIEEIEDRLGKTFDGEKLI